MKILGIESSATAASAAVCNDGKIISCISSNVGLTHSQTLLPMVEKCLGNCDLKLSDIDVFAVSNGPGSFTGVRIGVAALKGLAQPLSKKCIGISTLEVIAKPLQNTGCIAVSAMDARCSQVYTAAFDCRNGFERLTDDEAISIAELSEKLKQYKDKVVFIGDGALLCYNAMNSIFNCSAANEGIRFQNAASVALCAYEKCIADDTLLCDADELLPNYLRLSQAERELKKKQNN